MNDELLEKLAIREVVDNWAIWSDAGDWERFKTVWHPDAWMVASWHQSTGAQFVEARRGAFQQGNMILHFLGGSCIDVAGTRAIAQTKMHIYQRGAVHEVVCDIECIGRFYDFFEKRNGEWKIVLRRGIYEKDHLIPLDPSKAQSLRLDQQLLESFPIGYRYLAYFQTGLGYKVKPNLPGLKGPDVERLYARGRDWLAGKPMNPAEVAAE